MNTSASATTSGSKDDTVTGDVSLLEYLDVLQLDCLNESSVHTLKSIVSTKSKNTSSSYLISDADEQLLLNIPFNQSVRVRSIAIHSSVPEQAPKSIKLLINRPTLGFEDVEDAEEPEVAQTLELSPEDVKSGEHQVLRFVRFQAVNSLHIFVKSNQGGEDETRIDAIEIFGVPIQTTKDLSGLKQKE